MMVGVANFLRVDDVLTIQQCARSRWVAIMGCLCEDEADVELWKSEDIVNLYWALTYQYRALE